MSELKVSLNENWPHEKEGNVISFIFLMVGESFVFGAMWHNKSARSQKTRDHETSEPAVLLSRRSAPHQEKAPLRFEQRTPEPFLGGQQLNSSRV